MNNPDFRAMCAELVNDLEEYGEAVVDAGVGWVDPDTRELLIRARALLAQPEPEAPTDEEIMELMPQQMRDDLANAARALAGFDRANVKAAGAMRIILNRYAVNHACAALAKWGTLTPQPVLEEVAWLRDLVPAPQPVPVSQRLPGPEDCDAGECWAWDIAEESWTRTHYAICKQYTHWLPAHALPVPLP